MRERALLVGGRLHIGPPRVAWQHEPRGTTVRLNVTDVSALAAR